MYTFSKVLSDEKNLTLRRRIVAVEFVENGNLLTQTFQFSLNTSLEDIKRAVKSYLDELNAVIPDLTGDLSTVTEPTPEVPTQAKLDRQAWEADFAKLEKVRRLIDCGVLTGNETQIVTLRNKVKADFKPAYLA